MTNKTDTKTSPLTKTEKFVCEITWGCIPVDIIWVRQSKLFIEKLEEFNQGKYRDIYKSQKD